MVEHRADNAVVDSSILSSGTNLKEIDMAHKRKGQLTAPPQWWKHLRDWKRVFGNPKDKHRKRNEKDANKA